MPTLFHHTLTKTTKVSPNAQALLLKDRALSYQELSDQSHQLASQLVAMGLQANDRVAVYLPKQFETVISFYGASLAGGVFVPVNPLLKAPQVKYILNDCDVKILITSQSRYRQIKPEIEASTSIEKVILTDVKDNQLDDNAVDWSSLFSEDTQPNYHPRISHDIAAILYTSGSTGNPKGVVLSHQNLVAGAKSVAEYLNNHPEDRLLAVLPFSFDYGLSQLTTAFIRGASVVLMEYLLARDVIKAVAKYSVTGLAAVPPLWVQLAELEWPQEAQKSLRYFTNSGGAMPQQTLKELQRRLPSTLPYLMYGLTEAFRSTFLDPVEIENRPTSMGKAIPDAEILVINEKGKETRPGEEGELVHRGPHVALGYWNSPAKSAERFKPLPQSIAQGLSDEIAVWSGDTVVKDEQGFLYFVGRKDDMIKSSGYRISPSEVEDCVYQHDSVSEVAAIGIDHPTLGQAVVLVIKPTDDDTFDEKQLVKYCQKQLPNFMQPKSIQLKSSLPRNPNGKINRKQLVEEYRDLFVE